MIDTENYSRLPLEIKADITNIVLKAIEFINENISKYKILVHCNQGVSRSPSLALIYLKKYIHEFKNYSIEDFKSLYSCYTPKQGMVELIKEFENSAFKLYE